MTLTDLILKRDELSAQIQRITEQNQHADWGKYQISTDLLKRRRDALNWQILEMQDDDAYRLERESRRRRVEDYERMIKRDAARLPTLADALRQIREYPWGKV